MANYLVAVDASDNAKAAFYTAISMLKQKDKDTLYILSVVEDFQSIGMLSHGLPYNVYESAQTLAEKAAAKLLHFYGRLCQRRGIHHVLLMGVSNNVGEMVCQACEKKKIDFLVVGRRGIGKLKRVLVGSNSKYVMEHAKCNVMVVKGAWGPPEEHSDLQDIIKAEEAERQQREEEEQEEAKHKMERMNVAYDVK